MCHFLWVLLNSAATAFSLMVYVLTWFHPSSPTVGIEWRKGLMDIRFHGHLHSHKQMTDKIVSVWLNGWYNR